MDVVAPEAAGVAPLTSSEWQEAERAVAVARRAGVVAVSVRHVTLHLSTLGLPDWQAHGHGSQVHAHAARRGRGARDARRYSLRRGGRRSAGAAPAEPPSQSSSQPCMPSTPVSVAPGEEVSSSAQG